MHQNSEANKITALQTDRGIWLTEEKQIRSLFVSHFRSIYTKGRRSNLVEIYGEELLNSLPKIPMASHPFLEAAPSDQEILNALMSLAPNKSPGPDGFNAKMLQDNWASFGPAILSETKEFFRSGKLSPQVARSNLILIPKTEEPTEVGHFRPISVCNVLYKVISKLICLRLKPFIGLVISYAQSAFVPGRDISDNVILLREVLHSFKSRDFHRKGFCLKVDLSKAFDRMDWDYLEKIMPFYGFPSRLIMWIMGCVRSAEFSVVLNGVGDGFFKPQCGLRQGCALSPYLFILGMDLLCRSLENLASIGRLKGLRIAPQAPVLTSCVYADDLLLFGESTSGEAGVIKNMLDRFSMVSGQRVGPQKSSIWFSRATSADTRVQISQILEVNETNTSLTYLGAPVISCRESYDFLLEKVSSKLQTWKGRILSQAGRIVVIKSVLQALPVYFMSTDRIPDSVLNKITSLIRKFFWGALDKDKFLAYVAWSKIVTPVDQGGLGIRDLTKTNEALMMKLLWKLASGNKALWVDIARAKYIPRSDLWLAKRTYNCTPVWRAIMAIREHLLPILTWRLGDGRLCKAVAQPWFTGAVSIPSIDVAHRRLCVRDLVMDDTGTWNVSLLIELFGHQNCINILSSVQPPTDGNGADTLIFTDSSSGVFSVKLAYKRIANDRHLVPVDAVWNLVWKKGSILPRVRVFIWKLIHGALPLAKILSSRMSRGDPTCAVCHQGEEDVLHMLFFCPFARACWLAGPLALRTEAFASDLKTILTMIYQQSSDEAWTAMANSAWSIWRCRNEKVYGGQIPTFERFTKLLTSVDIETRIAASANMYKDGPNMYKDGRAGDSTVQPLIPQTVYCCTVDGSWKPPWWGGLGFVLEEGTVLKAYRAAPSMVCCPMQAEAVALRDAVLYVKGLGIISCTFYTDNQSLANFCSAIHPPLDADWRAYQEINDIWRLMKENEYVCVHVNRNQNVKADYLAKVGSLLHEGYTGFSYPTFNL